MKMPIEIKTLLSSFTIRLFVCFWLITIISIVCTRFISQQLSNEVFNEVINQESKPEELHQLHNTARRIKRSKITNISELNNIGHKRFDKFSFNIWLKASKGNQKITNLFPLPNKHKRVITNFIAEQKMSIPQTSIFAHNRLVGPLNIEIGQQSYQLFISKKQHRRNLGHFVQAIPYWARIAIPALISFMLCLLLAHTFSKPVRIIKKATSKIGQGDFSTRVEGVSQRRDELGQLANSFNEMATQLQQHQSAQQRLMGDVSHELRSPLTRLQMAIGLLQQDTTTEHARQQYLQRCQREIERLDQMIENVLALSRLENTLQSMEPQQVNLTTLVQAIINDEQFVANEKTIAINMHTTGNISLLADQTLLISAISNVLNNAVKYSPLESVIEVSLTKNAHGIELIISDNGEGVPEQALIQLFSPFYRVNLARDRNTGGTGLGLAIAKQAVIAHQGKIFATNKATTGLSVTIQLPFL